MTAEESNEHTRLQNNERFNNLLNKETPVIAEVSEAEENNMTQQKIGHHFSSVSNNNDQPSSSRAAVPPKYTEEQLRDRNRDSMFGTMLLSGHNNNMSKEQDKRMKQM